MSLFLDRQKADDEFLYSSCIMHEHIFCLPVFKLSQIWILPLLQKVRNQCTEPS